MFIVLYLLAIWGVQVGTLVSVLLAFDPDFHRRFYLQDRVAWSLLCRYFRKTHLFPCPLLSHLSFAGSSQRHEANHCCRVAQHLRPHPLLRHPSRVWVCLIRNHILDIYAGSCVTSASIRINGYSIVLFRLQFFFSLVSCRCCVSESRLETVGAFTDVHGYQEYLLDHWNHNVRHGASSHARSSLVQRSGGRHSAEYSVDDSIQRSSCCDCEHHDVLKLSLYLSHLHTSFE